MSPSGPNYGSAGASSHSSQLYLNGVCYNNTVSARDLLLRSWSNAVFAVYTCEASTMSVLWLEVEGLAVLYLNTPHKEAGPRGPWVVGAVAVGLEETDG